MKFIVKITGFDHTWALPSKGKGNLLLLVSPTSRINWLAGDWILKAACILSMNVNIFL